MGEADDWRNATPEHMFGRVLRPDEFLARATYGMAQPDERLTAWVLRYWSVQWRLGEGETFATATVDDCNVHLSRERGGITRVRSTGPGVWVTGPERRRRFEVTLRGEGDVVAIAFRTGGTLAFSGGWPADVVDRSVPGETWFAGVDDEFGSLPDSAEAAAPALDAWLLEMNPRPDLAYDRFRELLALLDDPSVQRLDDLAERAGCDPRTVQRTCLRYAGLGPKWLLMRARVIDAVAALDRGRHGTLTDLAAELGWFDQSHFTRDFRAITGQTPSAYLNRVRTSGGA